MTWASAAIDWLLPLVLGLPWFAAACVAALTASGRSETGERLGRRLLVPYAALAAALALASPYRAPQAELGSAPAVEESESAAAAVAVAVAGEAHVASPIPVIRFTADPAGVVWMLFVAALAATLFGAPRLYRPGDETPAAALWLLLATLVWLASAADPATLLAGWLASAVALWALVWAGADDDDARRGAGRMLLTGLVFDGVLILGAATVSGTPWTWGQAASGGGAMLAALGMMLSGMGRCGLAPGNGWVRPLRLLEGPIATPFWWLGTVPSAAILFGRASGNVSADAVLSVELAFVLGISGAMAAATALVQPVPRAQLAGLASACGGWLGLAACIGLGSVLAPVAVITLGAVLTARGRALPLGRGLAADPQTPRGVLLQMASRDWVLPSLWWGLVELPLRAASHLVRFVDGFVVDAVLGRSLRRIGERLASAGRWTDGDPGWLSAAALLVATAALIAIRMR
ncbi:MAG: hypothetical protein KF774_07875 [Planctomyces sp.]|nr:hypothetical protein [Planctomyces sp.]